MAHNSIMTESQRAARKFSDTDFCKRCGKYSESTLHAIRDCETVMPLWKTLIKQEHWSNFFSLNEKDWIKYNLDNNCSKNHVDDWNSMFGISCWYIWKQRNDWVFNNRHNLANSLIPIIYIHMRNFTAANNSICCDSNFQKHLEFISWKPPEQDWMKINVDGSHRKDDNSICCGGVVRDNIGRWITGFTKRLGHGSEFQAEIWAILLGLRFAHDKGFPKVIIETDSIMALNFVQSNTDIQHPLGGIRARIRELLSMDYNLSLPRWVGS
ncbi:ribonuclease H [Senna tora]|uniref:Ribonuclease H n=1 Tax=Senna tora TaxID=362788 RepID=A0A834TUB0_9FABA|nr:ribonuclease H [Senna tora]